jgi:ABC-type polysaccharide/polyol phosphate transport system ATPase subunit
MFIDELIDNGMDYSGADNALSVMQSMVYERNKNIFLISHKEELITKVNNVMIAVKENGFTSYHAA